MEQVWITAPCSDIFYILLLNIILQCWPKSPEPHKALGNLQQGERWKTSLLANKISENYCISRLQFKKKKKSCLQQMSLSLTFSSHPSRQKGERIGLSSPHPFWGFFLMTNTFWIKQTTYLALHYESCL